MVELSEGPVQRGNGKGGPTTPKPPLTPKGQASKGDVTSNERRLGKTINFALLYGTEKQP